MPFLTLEDPNAKIKGSRDPLALQPIWSRFARHFVTNLTTQTNVVRGFTAVLLGRYLAERLIQDGKADRGDALAIFLRTEQMCAYARHVGHGVEGDIRGIERVRRFADETAGRPPIRADAGGLILSDQKVNGLWGLYSVSARVSGLISDGPVGMEPAGREFVEAIYLPRLEPALGALLRLAAKDGVLRTREGDPLFEALSSILPEDFTQAEREFYGSRLRDAAHVKRARPGAQALLARLLRDHTDLAEFIGRDEMLRVARAAEDEDPELAHRLERSIRLEALFAPAAALFEHVLARAGQKPSDVGAAVRDIWGPRVPHLEQEHFEPLLGELRDASSSEIAREAERTRAGLESGSYAEAIRALLTWNAHVMRARGSAPWVIVGADDRLDVRYRGEERLLPDRDQLPMLWRNSYFLDSLKDVTRQLEQAA